MGEKTGISWTDHTFNPWWGCVKVSPGCERCYAETFSHRMGLNIWGKTERRFFGDKHWAEPLKWNKAAEILGVKRRVFCASMADVFEDFEGLGDQRVRLFRLIEATPQLEWLILTKRPENIFDMLWLWWGAGGKEAPDNVRIGVTCENQAMADRRLPILLNTWRRKTFISYEPALGPLKLMGWDGLYQRNYLPEYSWVICGGESGVNCRPMNLEWARSVRDQCFDARVPFFFKQIGGHPNKRHILKDFPEDLRIRDTPVY